MKIIFTIICCWILCTCLCILLRGPVKLDTQSTTLEKNGFIVIDDAVSPSQLRQIQDLWNKGEYKKINDLLEPELNRHIQKSLPKGYSLMDYIMFLENSVLHTCHRDNNAKQFNDINHRAYTALLYIDDMKECLDVIPGSHKYVNDFYFNDNTQTFMCKPGQLLIFDAGLVHAGSVNTAKYNRRIQFKITHLDDFQKLDYYSNYHKLINKPNPNCKFSKLYQKHLTCQYPIVGDLTQGRNRKYINAELGFFEKLFSKVFYGDANYYKLQDAF